MTGSFSASPGDRVHGHPGLVRGLAIAGVAIGSASLLGLLALPMLEPGRYSGLLIACCVATVVAGLAVAIAIVRRSRDVIVVNDEGLCCHSPGAAPLFVAWRDVGTVQPQNVMQRLVVTDRSGTLRIALEYHLERFGELRREVIDRVERASRGSGSPR